MKVSPVAGTPTIAQPSATGLSPEKLARIKGIATGTMAPEPTEEEKNKLLAATQEKITMQTNKNTPPRVDENSITLTGVEVENSTESIVSDASVQDSKEPTKASEVSADTQPLSPQLAAIARQKRALQVKERELAEKEKAIGTNTRAELEARLKTAPLSVLQELGVTYDQLTQEILGSQSQPNSEVQALKAEIAELKKGVDSKFSEAQVAQETQAINYVADKLDALVGQGDEFELLKLAEGEEEVIRRVYNHWKKTGKELDIAKVAKEYQEELTEEAVRYAKLKQVQGRLTPQEPLQTQATQSNQTGIRTLTNKDSARPTMDRKQRAILAMQGQLKR